LIVVKRYPNRKLYDTAAKRYISLDVLADLIRQGEEVQVLDHATGADLTVLVLAQIVAGQERKQEGLLPLSLLTSWIQAGGETLTSLRRALATQFDIVHQVDEEIERRLARLESQGELPEDEGQRLRTLLLVRGPGTPEVTHPPDQMLETFRSRFGLPSKADLQALAEQVDVLIQQVDELHPQTPAEP
jgi:polyhydroxyalkanoate synthesis repressor PhaR